MRKNLFALYSILLVIAYSSLGFADRLSEINERLEYIDFEKVKIQDYIANGQDQKHFKEFIREFDEEAKRLQKEKRALVAKNRPAQKTSPKIQSKSTFKRFNVPAHLSLAARKDYVDSSMRREKQIIDSLELIASENLGDNDANSRLLTQSQMRLSQMEWAKKKIEEELALRVPASTETSSQGAQLKVSGFGDAQFTVGHDTDTSPTFAIQDGALYLEGSNGPVKAFLDIPFKVKLASTSPKASDGVNFTLAQSKPQFFLTYEHEMGLSWTLGQFDTFYGYELNDTKDLFFSGPGLVFKAALPNVHTGLLAQYQFAKDYTFKLMAANRFTDGLRNRKNLDYGAQFAFSPGMFHGALGILYHKNNSAISEYLIDVLFGFSLGDVDVDFEFNVVEPDTGLDSQIALLGHFIWNVCDWTQIGLRAEWLSKFNSLDRELQFTFGPRFKINESMFTSLEYSFYNSKATSTSTTTSTSHSGALSAVYMF